MALSSMVSSPCSPPSRLLNLGLVENGIPG
jgi:hypothetical protein